MDTEDKRMIQEDVEYINRQIIEVIEFYDENQKIEFGEKLLIRLFTLK
ncbi:MAG: hypothetical protein LBU57_08045 [Dysgonamonadaceae bacterium]|jgi:hypothetical protein|nr:hypothetical protein [Dysgonamonadaceae bacterium]